MLASLLEFRLRLTRILLPNKGSVASKPKENTSLFVGTIGLVRGTYFT